MYLRSVVTVVVGLVICLVLTGLVATIAGARSSIARLDADVASALHADYSRDPQGIRFVPIDPAIIEVARDDAERFRPLTPDSPGEPPDESGERPDSSVETPDDPETIDVADPVEFVPIFRIDPTPAPSVTPAPEPGPRATTRDSLPTDAPTATPGPDDLVPPPAPTQGPTFGPPPPPTPAPTFGPPPQPSSAPTDTPTPTPTVPAATGSTLPPTPTPTPPPSSDATPTPTPTPTPSDATPVPIPTLEPTPTMVPTPTLAPNPTLTSGPTPTPESLVQTAVFTPVADSTIRSNGGSSNPGSAAELLINPHKSNTQRLLIRFDVSSVPAGATIGVATLRLCPTTANAGAAGRLHDVHRALGFWSESAVTWASQPPILEPRTDSSVYLGGLECVNFDVTDDVAAWVAGGANDGWLLKDRSEATINAKVTYASRENADTTLVPRLVVTFLP